MERRADDLLKAFYSKYILVLEIDLENDTLTQLYKNNDVDNDQENLFERYSRFNDWYCDERVEADCRADRKQKGTLEYIRDQLFRHDYYETVYTVDTAKWRKSTFISTQRSSDGQCVKALLCFEEESNYRAIKLKRLEMENCEYTQLISALAVKEFILYSWDVSDDTYVCIWRNPKTGERFDKYQIEGYGFSDHMMQLIVREVYDQDQEPLLRIMNRDLIKKELCDRADFSVNFRAKTEDGARFCRARFIKYGTADEVKKILVAVSDADERVREEMQRRSIVEDALLEARHVNEAKNMFLSNMSHDIRTPLNAVVGYASLAMADIDQEDKLKDYLNNILVSSRQLVRLVNDVLDLVRIESGRIMIEENAEDIKQIVEELREIIRPQVESKKLKFVLDEYSIRDTKIYCDKLRFIQIMLNLLKNAVNYTPEGGTVTFEITQRDYAPKGYVAYKFLISDTGVGMSEEFQSRVFEPFERESNSTKSGIFGTGLGLTIVRQLVQMMGGTVSFKSVEGEGTTFLVFLEFAIQEEDGTRAEYKASEQTINDEHLAEESAKELKHLEFEDKRFLVVEDNDINREILKEIMRRLGAEVDDVSDGNQAVDRIRCADPGYYDCVLMDVQMPVMDGCEATRKIRQLPDEKRASTAIIGVSANTFKEDRKKANEAGMDGYVAKPINLSELKKIIIDVIEHDS